MASGLMLGGMADGLNAGAKTAIEQQTETRNQETQQYKQINDQITATISHIGDIFKAQAEAGQAPDPNNKAVAALLDSIAPLAQKVGRDPRQLSLLVGTMAQRPPEKDDESKKSIVTTAGGLGEPDRIHVFDQKKGTLTPIDPKTGQPTIAPAPPAAANPNDVPTGEPLRPGQQGNLGTIKSVDYGPTPAVASPPPVQVASAPANATATDAPQPGAASFADRFAQAPAATATAPAAAPPNPNVNADAITSLSPGAQGLVKGVAEGTIDPTKAFSLRKGKDGQSERAKFLEAVKAYDPSFDMTNYGARAKTLNAFKSGVEARKVTSLGTVIGHVTQLNEEAKALDNWKSETFGVATKTMNQMRLWMKENEQSPIVSRFNANADAVVNELETAFRANNTSITGIQEWRKSVNPAMSSDQLAETTKKLGSLLRGRMVELEEQWSRGMGHNQDPSISMKLKSLDTMLGKMSAGTLLTDKTEANPKVQSLKTKYGLD